MHQHHRDALALREIAQRSHECWLDPYISCLWRHLENDRPLPWTGPTLSHAIQVTHWISPSPKLVPVFPPVRESLGRRLAASFEAIRRHQRTAKPRLRRAEEVLECCRPIDTHYLSRAPSPRSL
jgi:hypothetical protein